DLAVGFSMRSANDTVLHDEILSISLQDGEATELPRSIASSNWPLGEVALRLAEADDVLDSRTITVADLSPPQIHWTEPAPGAVLSTPISLRAEAVDTLGSVAEVRYRSVGSPDWNALPALPGDLFGIDGLLPADGPMSLELAATD